MVANVRTLFFILAVVCFALATLEIKLPRLNLETVGLLFLALGMLMGSWPQ
jgi:hypothetical protein